MSSTGKCQYCGSTISSEDPKCPNCSAPNPNYVEDTPRTVFLPKTVDELKEYCAERGMPLLRMRFFIDEDYREPRAFGIYRDGTDFVVYKNKSDGSRAVRYRGPDEEHAVSELFHKLLEECHNRGIYPDGKLEGSGQKAKKKKPRWYAILIFWVVLVLASSLFSRFNHRNDGYYSYDSGVYYLYGTDWYTSDSTGNWYYIDDFPAEEYSDYYAGSDYDSDWGTGDFKDSAVWESIRESHSSSSDDYDSWDSGGTDWDSDW